ncbi:MAG: 1,4-dihydroxy-6-naphthoate synthase [Saprospiraceae bacterium]|nr:1,4-dihydroxy-6-naphthoate synthase [Saprospiraceae bacterium]
MDILTLGFSPCPNDTFIFGALMNDYVKDKTLGFQYLLEDVEYLNRAAMAGDLDVVKVSYFAYTKLSEQYQLLTAGGALGNNCGPLLVSSQPGKIPDENSSIAIPGVNTTANLLLSLAYPNCKRKQEVHFAEIEKGVLEGSFDFGLIIHESRFTYQEKGLIKVTDLGEFWEEKTSTPIPLGAIAIKRSLPEHVKQRVNALVEASLNYAYEHPSRIMDIVRQHAQEMDEHVMKSHIDLYVTEFSKSVGTRGKMAAARLFHEIEDKLSIKQPTWPIYIDDI